VHSFVFDIELLIKNVETNKRNKGGDHIVTMLRWIELMFQMIEAMLLRLKQMLHPAKLG
jgi:hypothetical protein